MKIGKYKLGKEILDSIELKCLLVCKGVKVDKAVYKAFSKKSRLSINPLTCNSFMLSDNTIVQLTDLSFHLKYLAGMLSWSNLLLLKYASKLTTPFSLRLIDEQAKAGLFYENECIDEISFHKPSSFYEKKTTENIPFLGNAVLQGKDILAFQSLWPCELAYENKPCEFCFFGGDVQALAKKNKPLPAAMSPVSFRDIVHAGIKNEGARFLQLTGGSCADEENEHENLLSYLSIIGEYIADLDEVLLYTTPPSTLGLIDDYFGLGAGRIAYSLEVFDEDLARLITPGKIEIIKRDQYISGLTYISGKYGINKAFSNFIIGIEPLASLLAGASFLADRGIMPTASVWMPMGRPVQGSVDTPSIDYFRAVKEGFADLYQMHGFVPINTAGLNVCIEADIYRYMRG